MTEKLSRREFVKRAAVATTGAIAGLLICPAEGRRAERVRELNHLYSMLDPEEQEIALAAIQGIYTYSGRRKAGKGNVGA